MARALTPDELLATLKLWGIVVNEIPGWRTRNNKTPWGNVAGFLWHHTGDDAADNVDLRIVRDGHASLPGPLSQFGLRDDGSVDLIAAGPANHAGGGDPAVLALVRAGTYKVLPASKMAHGQNGAIGGNSVLYGVETYYSGTHVPTVAVLKTMPRLAAAVIHGLAKANKITWTAQHALGHKEWQRGKVDPGNVSCIVLRGQTQALLTAGPTPKATVPATPSKTVPPKPATKKPAPIAVNGTFDLATRKRLQMWAGVAQDGVLGPVSWRAIETRVRAQPRYVWYGIQRVVGSYMDNSPGPNTYRALQVYLNKYYA